MSKLNQSQCIKLAVIVANKLMDFETLYYSDYMNGNESQAEEVYDYVIEYRTMGSLNFERFYKDDLQ